MKLLNKPKQLDFLQYEFEKFKFELFSVDINDNLFMSCIVCWSNSQEDIVSFWKDIQGELSVKYQPEDEYARWNIYLIYLSKEKLSLDDKYRIENDKYFARKLVLDGLVDIPDLSSAQEMINCELFGHDMHLGEENKVVDIEGVIDSELLELIKKISLDTKKESKEIRANIIKYMVKGVRNNEN